MITQNDLGIKKNLKADKLAEKKIMGKCYSSFKVTSILI